MKKKLLIGMSIGCAALLTGTSVVALTHNNILKATAGGNERTLVFNEDSEITFSNNTATASEGNMRLYCDYGFDMGQGMFLTASGSSHYFGVYYNELVGGGYNVYQGFNEAIVTSVTIRYKTSNGQPLNILLQHTQKCLILCAIKSEARQDFCLRFLLRALQKSF